MYCSQKGLSGTIPDGIGDLTGLMSINMYNNKLSGTIPDGIGDLTGLTNLWLQRNDEIRGTIPAALGELTLLTKLYLSYNKLSGTIPAALAKLTRLTYLELYNNQLEGCVPQCWPVCSSGDLDLNRCFITWGNSNTGITGYCPTTSNTASCCAAGSFGSVPTDVNPSPACAACPVGWSAAEAGATECAACPAGQSAAGGATECTITCSTSCERSPTGDGEFYDPGKCAFCDNACS
jgi:hypothetical protein